MAVSKAPGANQVFFDTWLASDPTYAKMVLRAMDTKPFNGNWDSLIMPDMAMMFNIMRYCRHNAGRKPSFKEPFTASVGEVMAEALPAEKIMSKDDAIDYFCRTVAGFVGTDAELVTTKFADKWSWAGTDEVNQTALMARITDRRLLRRYAAELGLKAYNQNDKAELYAAFVTLKTTPPSEQLTNYMFQLLVYTLHMNPMYHITGTALILNSIVAFSKRGSITPRFVDKINSAMLQELGKAFTINEESIPLIYGSYGHYINETNAEEMFKAWKSLLDPTLALRLAITVQQASGSGLTALMVTRAAIEKYMDFTWAEAACFIPNEIENFLAGLRHVGNNPYFGFAKDLGLAKSTKYKNLSYIAKELLIKIDGQKTLSSYAGWTKSPPHKAEIDKLIEDYVNKAAATALECSAEDKEKSDQTVKDLEQVIKDTPLLSLM